MVSFFNSSVLFLSLLFGLNGGVPCFSTVLAIRAIITVCCAVGTEEFSVEQETDQNC